MAWTAFNWLYSRTLNSVTFFLCIFSQLQLLDTPVIITGSTKYCLIEVVNCVLLILGNPKKCFFSPKFTQIWLNLVICFGMVWCHMLKKFYTILNLIQMEWKVSFSFIEVTSCFSRIFGTYPYGLAFIWIQ